MPECAALPADGTKRARVAAGYRLLSRFLLIFGLAGALKILLQCLCWLPFCWSELPQVLALLSSDAPAILSVCFLLGGWWFHRKATLRGPRTAKSRWQIALVDILAGSLLIGTLVALGSAHRTQIVELPIEVVTEPSDGPEAEPLRYRTVYLSNVTLEKHEPAYLGLVILLGLGFTLATRHQRVGGLNGTSLLVSAWALLLRILGLASLAITVFLLMEADIDQRGYIVNALIPSYSTWHSNDFVCILHMGMICFPLGLFFRKLVCVVRHPAGQPDSDDPDWRLVSIIAEWLWCISVFAATYLTWSWVGVQDYLEEPYEGRFHDVLAGLTGVVLLAGVVCIVKRPGSIRKWVLGMVATGFLGVVLVWICRGHPRNAFALTSSLLGLWLVFLLIRGTVLPVGVSLKERTLALGEVLLRYGGLSTALLTVPLYLLGLVLFVLQSVPEEFAYGVIDCAMDFTTWTIFLKRWAWLTHHGLLVLVGGGVLVIACRTMVRRQGPRSERPAVM